MAVIVVAMSSAERLDRLIGMVIDKNTDGWCLIKEEIDY
jgi:hypothetical protein